MLSARQLAARATGIGSSEIAGICGLSPFASPLDYWLVKTGRRAPFAGNYATELGHILEPHILQFWLDKRGATRAPKIGTVRDRKHDWLFATPDLPALIGRTRYIVDAKHVGFHMRPYWKENDELPEFVTAQLQIQQRVTRIYRSEAAVWIDGERDPERAKRIVPCPYDPALVRQLIEQAEEFWRRYVLEDREPPIDASASWSGYLKEKYPRDERPVTVGTSDVDALVIKYLDAHDVGAKAEQRKTQAKHELEALIADGGGFIRPGKYRATWLADVNGNRRIHVKATSDPKFWKGENHGEQT